MCRWGYCGPGADHCECDECVDFRPKQEQEEQGINTLVETSSGIE